MELYAGGIYAIGSFARLLFDVTTNKRSPRRTKTIDSILHARRGDRVPGLAYKLAPGSESLAMDVLSEPRVDRGRMAATAIISTPVVDRVGDVLNPLGCKLDNYRKNPAVLWAHGFDDITLPVGKSEDPDGNLSVSISEEGVAATCFFSQRSLEAAQIFELVDEGIVRGTSVRETPIVSSFQRDQQYGDLLIVDEWDLEEWSWCCVGVNPEAVAKALGRNRLAGKPIVPSILKSLSAVAPSLKHYGKGFDPAETVPVKKRYTPAQLKAMSDEDLTKAKADAENPEAITDEEKRRKAETPAETETETEVEPTDEDSANTPYGAQVVSAVHAAITGAIANIEQAMGPLENPEVKAALGDIMAALGDQCTALEGVYTAQYPEQPALKADCGEQADAAEAMKAFLASGRLPQLQMAGIGARLKSLASSKNLNAEQRGVIGGIVGHLARLGQQAKSYKPAAKSAQTDDADEEKRKALQAQIQAANDQLARLTATK